MTSRPVDAAIVKAFLETVSPMSLELGLRVLEQLEQDLAAQRRQRELQLEQARYEARLAQRQYDAVDPDHRLVASELERRWNEKLERVTHLEQAYAQAEQEAQWDLTAEERQGITGAFPESAATVGSRDHHQSGAKAFAAHGHGSGTTGWCKQSWGNRGADSMALGSAHQLHCQARCAGGRIPKDASGSGPEDSRNGGRVQLRRNRQSSE